MRAAVLAAVLTAIAALSLSGFAAPLGGVSIPAASAGHLTGVTPTAVHPATGNYSVTFNESGLPNGSTWNVTVNLTGISRVASIPTADGPKGILYDPLTDRIYVAASNNGTVQVIDPATNLVLTSIPVGSDPRYLALDPAIGELFVTNTLSNNVSVINASDNLDVGSIPVGANPIGINFDPANGYLYVADSWVYTGTESNVSVINASSQAVVATIPVGSDARDLAYDPLNELVYVANYGDSNLTIINTTQDRVTGAIELGAGVAPSAPAVDLANGELYVSNNTGAGAVFAINPASDAISTIIRTGLYPARPVYDPANGFVYVGNEYSDTVSVISTTLDTVVGSIPTGLYPATIGIDSSSSNVYIVEWDANEILVVTGSAPIGNGLNTEPGQTLSNTTADGAGSVVFSLAPGNYSYQANPPAAYVGLSGGFQVTDAAQYIPLYFTAVGYPVQFEERGLDPFIGGGYLWTVTFDGVARSNGPGLFDGYLTSFGDFPNGTYSYSIAPVAGYILESPAASGLITIAGAPLLVNVTFSVETYTATYTESGLSAGSLARVGWTVVVGGSPHHADAATISVANLIPGIYSTLTLGPSGEGAVGGSASELNLSGNTSVPVAFHHARTYTFTFARKGLPTGQSWCPTLELWTVCTTTGSVAYRNLTADTYSYGIRSPTAGQIITATVGGGGIPPSGLLGISQNVRVVFDFTYDYAITFTESGLPPSTSWSVTVRGVTQTTSGTTLTFEEVNGTYGFRVAPEPGYQHVSGPTPARVHGASVDVSVAFFQLLLHPGQPSAVPLSLSGSSLPTRAVPNGRAP